MQKRSNGNCEQAPLAKTQNQESQTVNNERGSDKEIDFTACLHSLKV